jgi:hypothetical protein
MNRMPGFSAVPGTPVATPDDMHIQQHTRSEILGLLSDDEIGAVSAAEEQPIPEGNDYLDLEHLERGVQQATRNTSGTNALPRTAVSDETWIRILDVLETPIQPS